MKQKISDLWLLYYVDFQTIYHQHNNIRRYFLSEEKNVKWNKVLSIFTYFMWKYYKI